MVWRRLKSKAEEVTLGYEYPTDARARPRVAGATGANSDGGGFRVPRSGVVFVLAALFVIGALAAFFGEGGYLDMQRLRDRASDRRLRVAAQRIELSRLELELERLQSDPSAVERIAREELGLVRPGEIDFLLPREKGDVAFPVAPEKDGKNGP